MRSLLYPIIRLSIVLLFLLLFSCNRRLVNLDYTNAAGEVPPLTNLVFRFNRALVNDSLTNRWDSGRYVSFEPAIPGRFRWEHADELVFSPSGPLRPATGYHAKLDRDLLQYSQADQFSNAANIDFHTPLLKLENAEGAWVKPEAGTQNAVPELELDFNYTVDPATLKEKMKLTIDGKPVTYAIQTLSKASRIAVRVADLKMTDRDYDAAISLDKGLLPAGGVNGTDVVAGAVATIPSPFVLRIGDMVANQENSGGSVRISTSQPVTKEDLAQHIVFSPAVKFTSEITPNGFVIRSDQFNTDKTYQVTISKGMRGSIGGSLHEDYISNLAFGALEPAISFPNPKGVYLSGKGEKNLEVRLTNVAKVKIIISKIYENNLLAAQRNGYSPADNTDNTGGSEYDDNGDYHESSPSVAGDVIFTQEVETRLLPGSGNSRIYHLDFADKLRDLKGIYHIAIRSAKDYWVSDSRFLSLSDIGLMAREGSGKLVVFANSIQTATALKGISVVAYGANNQVLGLGATDENGVAEIKYSRREFAGFKPAMIIAKTADDFTYLPFSNTHVNTSRFDVGGKSLNATGLDAFIYPERDIYRPGEKINFSVILRDYQWHSPGDIPVKMKFLLPNGKELKAFRKNLNAQGSLESSLDLPVTAITGSYSLEVYSSNDVLLNTQAFRVEEFVPDRIKVTAKLSPEILEPGQKSVLALHADNFFGPPAADRNYECEIQVKQSGFYARKFNNFSFSLTNQKSFFDKVVREGKTDASGDGSEPYEVQEMFRNLGVLQADFYTTVFDETGRPVSRLTSAKIFTQPYFLGIADDGNYYYALNREMHFSLIALDRQEKVLDGMKAEVSVIKHEYRTVLTKSGSYFRYESQQEDKLVTSGTISVSGEKTTFPFTPRSAGNYEVRVTLPGANSYISRSFYSYGYSGTDNSSFEVNNEGEVNIAVDKENYLGGESAKVLLKAPFDGRMLVTLETDKIISYQYVNIVNKTATLEMKLPTEAVPNAYITATLIKPHGLSDIPLTVAHGIVNVTVEEKSRRIGVKIEAKTAVRSRSRQDIVVRAAPNSLVTLAAVDNGVLQVSGFETPDPYGYFYAKRALAVDGYDLYQFLLPELRARLSSTGGDQEQDMNKRTNPMPAKRINIMSYWSGIKQADGSGTARFSVDLPAFSGQLRLMAVAYNDNQFGSVASTMTVADPLVLSTALPRFLTPSDSARVALTVTNTTNGPASGSATLKTTGGLLVGGENTQAITLPAHGEKRVYFDVIAKPEIGIGKVAVTVNGLGEKFLDETEIGVRPAASLEKTTGSGRVAAGATESIHFSNTGYIPSSISTELLISRFPAAGMGKYLSALLTYPYGCTEQTVSAAFPQLYYGDLSDALQIKNGQRNNANFNVQEAIRKIRMRQLYNGAITLWDNEGSANWWTTVYAAHFLVEAGKAGFDVDKSLLETTLGYLNGQLRNRKTINYYYNRNQNKKIVPKEVIYSLYVLALNGKPNMPVMNYYKASPALLSLDCKYLLAAAYALAGDKGSFKQFLPGAFTGEESVAETGGSFYSDIRDEAIALDVLVEVDPGNAQVPVMARHVTEKLNQRSWYSTQELAFSFLALGKIARQQAASEATADIRSGGKTIAHFTGKDLRVSSAQLNGAAPEIVCQGKGNLFFYWEQEGIPVSAPMKESDSYLKVRKHFFDRFGHPLAGASFKQNELVIVQLTLEKSFSGSVDNVVVTDLLPAGFEIENPRTKEIPGMEWIKDAATPSALDVRDDRINLFVDVSSSKQNYYYAVRAVSPGTFKMGPVSADAMYNGEYHSYRNGGTIRISE